LEVYEHSHDIELPTNKPIILGARRSSDLTKHDQVQSNGSLYTETYRKLHISINGTEVIAFDLYTIPNSGNTASFWNSGLVADGIDSAVLGDTRFIIQNLEYPGDYSNAELTFWGTEDPLPPQEDGVLGGPGTLYMTSFGDFKFVNKNIETLPTSRVSTDNAGVSIIVHAGSPVFPAVPNGDSFDHTVWPLKPTENGVSDVNSVSAYIASSDETHQIVQEIFFITERVYCYSRDGGVSYVCQYFGEKHKELHHMIIFEKDGQHYSVYGNRFNAGDFTLYSLATEVGDTPSDAGYPSTAYVGDIVMVGQKLNVDSAANPRFPVESVEVEVLTKPMVVESLLVNVGATITQGTLGTISPGQYIKNTSANNGGYYRMTSIAAGTSGVLGQTYVDGVHYEREFDLLGNPSDPNEPRYYKLYTWTELFQDVRDYGLSDNEYGTNNSDIADDSGLIKDLFLTNDPEHSPVFDIDVHGDRSGINPSASYKVYPYSIGSAQSSTSDPI
jgi:hypothetical protein